MTKAQLRNALCILNSIDRHEMEDEGIDFRCDTDAWLKFRDDPYGWFLKASDADADKLWAIVERRAGR